MADDGGGKWQAVKTTGKKNHPRKDPERKKLVQVKKEREQQQQASQQEMSHAVAAALLGSREKGLAKPNENGTFSVAVDRTKLPKSVSKLVAAEEAKKNKGKSSKKQPTKKKSRAASGSSVSVDAAAVLAAMTPDEVKSELAVLLTRYPNQPAIWLTWLADLYTDKLQGCSLLLSLSEPSSLLAEEGRSALIVFLRDRIPVANRLPFVANLFEQGETASAQLLLQLVAAAWPEQLMSSLESASVFSPLHSLALGSVLANAKLASRGVLVWLTHFVKGEVRSEEHLLCLERVKRFTDPHLSIETARILAKEIDEDSFGLVAARLPAHPEVFAALLPTAAYAETQVAALPVLAKSLLEDQSAGGVRAGSFGRWRVLADQNTAQTANLLMFLARKSDARQLKKVRARAEDFLQFVIESDKALPEAKRAAGALQATLQAKSWLALLGTTAAVAAALAIGYGKYAGLI